MKREGEQPYYTMNRLCSLSSPVTLSTKIKCDEGGGRTRDGHRSRNKRSLRILLRYTHSLPRRLPGCPARSLGAPSLHSYLHTEEEEGDYRATEESTGRRRLREHLPIDRGRVKSTAVKLLEVTEPLKRH